jgi:DNA repair protein RadC
MNAFFKLNETKGTYSVNTELTENDIVEMAIRISRAKVTKGSSLTSPQAVKIHLQNLMGSYEREAFGVLLLDNQHNVLHFEELFFGTIDTSSVYPREVVKVMLKHNAQSCIFVHNHPSGHLEASGADRAITTRLQNALNLIDATVLDHFIVSREGTLSFAEKGYL